MLIKWIGQSGYILNDGHTEICIDPYLSDIVGRLHNRPRMIEPPFTPDRLRSDVVICTHNHLDHVDIDAIPLMKKDDMLFLAPTDAEKTLKECGVTKFKDFNEGDKFSIGKFELEAVCAFHSAPAIGIIVRHDGRTLYFSGDTLYDEKLKELKEYNIDVMFICINGKLGNMDVEEAVEITKTIKPKAAIPTHYGMFESNTEDPKKFTSKIDCGFEMEYNKVYVLSSIIDYSYEIGD